MHPRHKTVGLSVRHIMGVAMLEEHARQVIDELLSILRSPEVDLRELVEQHLDAVEHGRLLEPDAEDSTAGLDVIKSKKSLPGDVRRRDLTVTEQLSGLIDLVEVAVAGAIDVEERTFEMALEFLPDDGNPVISFSDDVAESTEEENSPQRQIAVDEVSFVNPPNANEKRVAREIMQTLEELRNVTSVSRAEWLEPQDQRLRATTPTWRPS